MDLYQPFLRELILLFKINILIAGSGRLFREAVCNIRLSNDILTAVYFVWFKLH